jgi:hypothetical protein
MSILLAAVCTYVEIMAWFNGAELRCTLATPTPTPWVEDFCFRIKHAGHYRGFVQGPQGELFIMCDRADFQRTSSGWRIWRHYE